MISLKKWKFSFHPLQNYVKSSATLLKVREKKISIYLKYHIGKQVRSVFRPTENTINRSNLFAYSIKIIVEFIGGMILKRREYEKKLAESEDCGTRPIWSCAWRGSDEYYEYYIVSGPWNVQKSE